MKRFKLIFLLGLIVLFLSGCAGVEEIEKCLEAKTYGFWYGLWHGFITPFSFLGSLFKDDIAVYAVNNNGGWYDFGFVLGASIIFGGSGKASKR